MDQQNIDRVNGFLADIDTAIEHLRVSIEPIYTALDRFDDTLETIEIKVGIIGAYLIEEGRKEKLRCESK